MPDIFNIRTAQVASVVVGVAVAVGMVMSAQNEESSFNTQYAANANQITKLEQQLNDAETPSTVGDAEAATVLLNSAADLGKEICDKQNEMFNEDDVDKLVEGADYVGSRLTDASQRYRGTWLLGVEDDLEWEFCTTYDFTGSSFPVVWLAHSKTDGVLLGYATAEYLASTHQFDNLKVTMTTEGTQRMGVAEESTEEANDTTNKSTEADTNA